MRIDRARFLVLASTIAAACGPRQPASEAPNASSANATNSASNATGSGSGVTSSVDGGVPIPVNTDPSLDTPIASDGDGWPQGGSPAAEGYPAGEGYYAPKNVKKKPPPKPQCGIDEDVGSPGNCASLVIDKSCAPFPFINSACADSAKFMKPAIAERAVACIRSKAPKQLCDAMSVYDCKDDALHTACPDPTADADCATIQQSCKKTTRSECRTYLSGLNALGRSEMVKCMKSDCTWGLYSCSEGL